MKALGNTDYIEGWFHSANGTPAEEGKSKEYYDAYGKCYEIGEIQSANQEWFEREKA
jgi:hypothetical protein